MPYPAYRKQFESLTTEQKTILDEIPNLENIEGWLLLVEAVELFRFAHQIMSPKPVVCEIGSWKGKSSYVFASAMKKVDGLVYSIDPFNGEGDSASQNTYKEEMAILKGSLLENFENTMNRYGLRDCVHILPHVSEVARQKFNEPRIDLLFIDGNHEYDFVKKDYELWSPLIPSGGIIVLHDVKAIHVDGPKRIFEEYIAHNPVWKNARIIGEMGVATKV